MTSPLAPLIQAAASLSLLEVKDALRRLSAAEKAQCWAQPRALAQVLEAMPITPEAMCWIPALQVVEMLLNAGATGEPLATDLESPSASLQLVVSDQWLPLDAAHSPLRSGERQIALRVLTLLAERSAQRQVPGEGLGFDDWMTLDPWTRLFDFAPCRTLACQLLEARVFPGVMERPVGRRGSAWPTCPLQEVLSERPVDIQARVWCAVMEQGYRLPPVLDNEPTLHHFCGLDMRPGAPLLKAALLQGLNPRSKNSENQSALECALSVMAPSLYDAVVLLDHDMALLDEPSSDGRTVYVVLLETLKGAQAHTVVGLDDPAVANLGARARAYRRGAQIDERLPAAEILEPRARF